VAAFATDIESLQLAGSLLVLVALVRAALAVLRRSATGRTAHVLQALYPVLAVLFAGTIGACAALALELGAPPDLQILLVGYAMTVGAGIAIGNAGRPLVVIGQMVVTFLPIALACFARGSLPLVALGLILPCLTVALSFLTFSMFNALSRHARMAAESEFMALQLRDQALIDALTGLPNRNGFEAQARRLLDAPSADDLVALLWMDVRRFKDVNDMLGHQMGDEVLRTVADRLRERAPEGAMIARFGGDEFLLLARFANRTRVESLAGLLSADMAAPLRVAGQRIDCGASLGIALINGDTPDLDRLMQHADLARYYAKTAGTNQVCFFTPSMTRTLVHRKEMESELRAAIRKDELSIYFQPIIDLATGRIRAFEALVRWFHPTKGELLPDDFIPVAEDTGLIITLGNWITRTAARAAANWPDDVLLAVNLSPVQIHAPGAALGILTALREAQLPASRLELEVTESLFLEDNDSTALFMEMLAAEGVRFSLDDFGTGYSSLHYISKYPFRTIKVDRSFVSGPDVGRKTDAIIRAVAEMGVTLGMEIVAEGLETSGQVDTVRRAGCTLGQGWHFSRAVPEHLALRLLEDERLAPERVRRVG
jgi:diguanylate cyclase (GGDEF)-like protein